jgi:hypothetical protein
MRVGFCLDGSTGAEAPHKPCPGGKVDSKAPGTGAFEDGRGMRAEILRFRIRTGIFRTSDCLCPGSGIWRSRAGGTAGGRG